jgi:mono/diheme cytochrome c family protein
MRVQENNLPLMFVALVLTVVTLILFQVYIQREPARVERVLAEDHEFAFEEGQALYAQNCALCHGGDGEGGLGPALNSQELLGSTADNTLFSLVSSGVPGTGMPAWSQAHGGPLTDEQIRQVVTYVRAWEGAEGEAVAQASEAVVAGGDPANGQMIFSSTCFVCHGANGEGDSAPALNNPAKLVQFDDEWYVNVVREGRPAQGMPTWGTVLSPQDIADVVAFIRQWESSGDAASLQPDAANGQSIYTSSCVGCHGADGAGGVGPALNDPAKLAEFADDWYADAIAKGRPAQGMPAWESSLSPQDIADLVAFIRQWEGGS